MWKIRVEDDYRVATFLVKDMEEAQKIITMFDEYGVGDFKYKLTREQEGEGNGIEEL